MITYEQIKWTTSTFKEIRTILDTIPDFRSYYFFRDECLSKLEYHLKDGTEFFFDEDYGLYKIRYDEHGQFSHEVFGKTKKEVIRHVVDRSIVDDASLHYAAQKFWKKHPNTPLPFYPNNDFYDLYNAYVKERIFFCHSIVDPYIHSLEDTIVPSIHENQVRKVIKSGTMLLLSSMGEKYLVKVSAPHDSNYSCLYLGVLHEECGQNHGAYIHLQHEVCTLDISYFMRSNVFLTLEAELSREKSRTILERLDIESIP